VEFVASGPYAAEENASRPRIDKPRMGPINCYRFSADARRRPKMIFESFIWAPLSDSYSEECTNDKNSSVLLILNDSPLNLNLNLNLNLKDKMGRGGESCWN
jgi:hypothetical protein